MLTFALFALVSTTPTVSMFEEAQPSARLLELDQMSLPELQAEKLRLKDTLPSVAPGVVMMVAGGLVAGLVFIAGGLGNVFAVPLFVGLFVGGLVVGISGIAVFAIQSAVRRSVTRELRYVDERIRNARPELTPPPLLQSTLFEF